MEELWLPVVGREESYQVSSLGRVKSLARTVNIHNGATRLIKETVLASYANASLRYPTVPIGRKTVFVHRLVAQAFIPNPLELPEVNHKDGNRANNRVGNLEWVSSRGNKLHAIHTGLHTVAKGEQKVLLAKLRESDVLEIRRLRAAGHMQQALAKQFNVSRVTISQIVNRLRWKHI